jgi:hypothetical protein
VGVLDSHVACYTSLMHESFVAVADMVDIWLKSGFALAYASVSVVFIGFWPPLIFCPVCLLSVSVRHIMQV